MTPSDFDQVSLLRQELKQAIEVFSAAQHRTSSSDVVSPVLPPVSSIPVSSGKKGASQLPSMRRAQSSVLSRTSLTAVEDDATPVLTSKNSRPQTAAPGRSSWLARKSSVVPSAPSVQQTTSSAPSSSHPLMFSQEMEQSNIAARFYQTAAYDRANQRILFHGGLRRDKPSRLCISQIFAVDLSESRKDSIKYTWQVGGSEKKKKACKSAFLLTFFFLFVEKKSPSRPPLLLVLCRALVLSLRCVGTRAFFWIICTG